MTKYAQEVHDARVEATLAFLREGSVESFYEACVRAGEQEGVKHNTIHTSWNYATAAQKLERKERDPIQQRRQRILGALMQELEIKAHQNYHQACIAVGQQFGITGIAVRQVAERMDGLHPFWEVLYRCYPETHMRS